MKILEIYNQKIGPRLYKFLLTGIVNTIFGYLLFSLLIFLGLHYYFALFLATCISVFFNFKTIGTYVFKDSNNSLLMKFFAVYGVVYVLNVIIIKTTLFFTANVYIGGAIATIVGATVSFLLNKKYVFANQK